MVIRLKPEPRPGGKPSALAVPPVRLRRFSPGARGSPLSGSAIRAGTASAGRRYPAQWRRGEAGSDPCTPQMYSVSSFGLAWLSWAASSGPLICGITTSVTRISISPLVSARPAPAPPGHWARSGRVCPASVSASSEACESPPDLPPVGSWPSASDEPYQRKSAMSACFSAPARGM